MHRSLFQINTRTMLRQLRDETGSAGTLDDIPDEFLDRLQERRFDWVWLLGVWQTGMPGVRSPEAMKPGRRSFES